MASPTSGLLGDHASHPQPPRLEAGDRLTRAEFERRYDAMPHLMKAELIEGIVYMPAAVRFRGHGRPHSWMVAWLAHYESETPGLGAADNTSVRLDLDNEPQPDGVLFIESQFGGQVTISGDDYIEGAPELAVEVASSSVSYDLGVKLTAYRRNGIREYLVWRVLDGEFDWFELRQGRYEKLAPDAAGILRGNVFPGLWLDTKALLAGELKSALATLQLGVASPEHDDFLRRLQPPSAS